MSIIIDNREQSILDLYPDAVVSILNIGDFQIVKDDDSVIVVERKTVADFLSSVKDGRIWDQANNMKKHKAFLVIVGDVENEIKKLARFGRKSDYYNKLSMFKGAIRSLLFNTDIQLHYVKDDKELRDFIYKINESKLKGDYSVVKKRFTGNVHLDLITALPGINIKRGKLILQHFDGSFWHAFNDLEEWEKIRGIGNKIISKIENKLMSDLDKFKENVK